MIAGLEEISGGEMYIGDRLINDVPPKDRDIAMVFQNYALYPHMTVYKNMAFGLELRKMPKDEIDKRVREAAKILEIEHLLDRKPKALSGGQRQRVALGRAMVRNPAVFLLDEPLSNLDAKLRTSMRTEIIKLHKKLATTFIYVTHDQTEAMTMGDRIVVMKDGMIQQVDTPQNLYDYPCNIFVAGFIGSPQMNFLDGTLKKAGDQFIVDLAGTEVPLPKEKTADGKLDAYVGKTLKVGIRPEDIKDDEEFLEKHPNSHLSAEVEVSELMGAEIYLYLTYQGQNLQNVERLGHVVVRAVFQAEDFVHILALGGQHDNRHTGCFADALADAESVHLRQHHVQQHKIIHPGKEFVQRFLTIHGGIGFVAVLFKRIFQAFQNKRLIVHQQNAFSHDGSPQYNLPRTAARLLYPEL